MEVNWSTAKTLGLHDCYKNTLGEPSKVSMMNGAVPKSQPKESLADVFVCAATAVAKVFSPSPTSAVATGSQRVPPSPRKKSLI